MRNIVKNVWSFIDNITNGLVDKDLIDAHKIPHEIIDVIKSPNHPSYKKIRNDLFVHIMENIGYYEHIKDERFIILLANNISLVNNEGKLIDIFMMNSQDIKNDLRYGLTLEEIMIREYEHDIIRIRKNDKT